MALCMRELGPRKRARRRIGWAGRSCLLETKPHSPLWPKHREGGSIGGYATCYGGGLGPPVGLGEKGGKVKYVGWGKCFLDRRPPQ